jgi:hypothetical protein
VNLQNGPLDKGLLALIAPLIVLPPWIWMAVRTQRCLQIVTAHTIPIAKRTIWLMKTLALIVGVGGLFGAVVQVGIPWLLAILPGGIIIFFALKESVQEVVPPKPSQDAATYQLSWETYRTLRSDFLRSWKWIGASFLMLILAVAFADKMQRATQIALFAFCGVAVLSSMVVMSLKQLKWLRWPCPRCGCAFRGFWNRLWLPKKCAYCGLPRADRHIFALVKTKSR